MHHAGPKAPETPEPVAEAAFEPTVEPSAEPTVEAPKPYASKSDWVDYAISKGLGEDEANSLSKSDLIELYG